MTRQTGTAFDDETNQQQEPNNQSQTNISCKISHIIHSTLTANALIEENEVSAKEKLYNKKITKLQRRKKKQALERFVKKIYPKKRRSNISPKKAASKKIKAGGMLSSDSIRTHHEQVFESYLSLLEMPYLINNIFCFNCSCFYNYGDQISIPKKCQVCREFFYTNYMNSSVKKKLVAATEGKISTEKEMKISHMSRPDFILDYNSDADRKLYKKYTMGHKMKEIEEFLPNYLKKVAIVRIDGSIHQKQSQMIKDYHQYQNYKNKGVKVFIVQNDLIDDLLATKDNGKALLRLCHDIGNAVIDDSLYEKYANSPEFRELVRKPF